MTANEIIRTKRDAHHLSKSQIEYFIEEYVAGNIPDYQASALLMAIYFNGMDDQETTYLTNAMANSGNTISLKKFRYDTVDKHSTGGVGDKTTLIVSPIAACLGCKVAKMSGRGLGFTGGTVDKLMSIPNYKISPPIDEFFKIVEKTGVSVIRQSDFVAPADKKLYALRDVTGSVESLPLIASSIMSKKIALGSHSIVLDVKVGSGAFMKSYDDALLLANTMVNIGRNCNRNMAAIITNMNTPLGNAIGNNLEVIEAIKLLKGEYISGLYEECVAIAGLMVAVTKSISLDEAEALVKDSISSGAAYNKFIEWISAQGGDISYIENTDKFEKANICCEVISEKSGYIFSMDTEAIGSIAGTLGAGRKTVDDTVDYTAGIILHKKTGDYVSMGEKLCTLFTNNSDAAKEGKTRYLNALKFADDRPKKHPTIYKIIH